MELLNLGIKSIFIDNMVFAYFLGMCSFLAVSKKVTTAIGLGAAVVFVLAITAPINWLVQEYILQEGALSWLGADFADLNLEFLQFITKSKPYYIYNQTGNNFTQSRETNEKPSHAHRRRNRVGKARPNMQRRVDRGGH